MLLTAAVLYVIGSVVSWAEGSGPTGRPMSYRATQGTGEGVFLIAGGLLLAILARNRLLWETTSRSVQLLPLMVAAVGVAMWLGAEHFAGQYIADWVSRGGDGQLTIARYLVGGAIILTAVAFAYLERKRPLDVRAGTQPLWIEWGLTRWSVAVIAAASVMGAIGAAVGVLAGIVFASAEFVLVAVLAGVFGLFIGIGLGVVLVRELEALAQRRRR